MEMDSHTVESYWKVYNSLPEEIRAKASCSVYDEILLTEAVYLEYSNDLENWKLYE